MAIICPQPRIWDRIYRRLLRAWEQSGRIGERPPVPLILAGWACSNDVQKAERWSATLEWARDHDFAHLVPQLSKDDLYVADDPTTCVVGPLGGPMYLAWDFDPKVRPTAEDCARALESLRASWTSIVGEPLAAITQPTGFSGRKLRCLRVTADFDSSPPWGTWESLRSDPSRRAFTEFRAAINGHIQPLHVDHVLFHPGLARRGTA